MKKTFIAGLMIVGVILVFFHGLSSGVQYQAFKDWKNYSEAYADCRGKNFESLAKIAMSDQLNQARNSSGYDNGKKHWTALQVLETESEGIVYRWSYTRETFSARRGWEVVPKDKATTLVEKDRSKVYCFLITTDDELLIENCSRRNAYICERSEVLSTNITDSKSTQIRPTIMTTPLMSVVTATFTSRTTAASNILVTRTFSITTDVSTSVSPTSRKSAKETITDYLVKLKQLSADDEDSLQIAVNETQWLLRYFSDSSNDKMATNLLVATRQLESFAMNYSMEHLTTNGTSNANITSTGEHFVMEVRSVSAGHDKDVSFPSEDDGEHFGDGTPKISVPAELFGKHDTYLVGILYNDMHRLLPKESHSFLDGKKLKNTRLQTQVIACSIFPHFAPLPKNVTISFTMKEPLKVEDTPICVFWDFDIRSRFNGSWSNRGCTLINKTNTKVVCSCSHLTNFAVLLQVGETKISERHQVALEIITYIGCGLSLVGETLTILTYLVLMNLKQEQCQIRLNLVIAIAVAQIIFLAGIDATSKQGACIFAAVSIHYFYLVGFAWMLMEGIYLYLMVVKVFNALIKIKLFYAFSWGFPLLMVVCSIVIASGLEGGITSYIHSDYCWVSFSSNLVWTFAAPVLVVCLINSFILCRVVYEMTKMQGTKDISNVKQGLKACAVLFPLLGMTWVFGILSVTDAGLVFQYIFTILNSLQGFFIFIMHVLRSTDVRTAYLRKKQKWQNTKNSNFPSSRSVVENSNARSEKHAMGNLSTNRESPDPTFRRHQISPINSDRMDTRESCLTPVN